MSQPGHDNDQQTILKMEKAITSQMEELIPEMQQMARDHKLAGDKSPFRNVLNVAVDAASDVEVTKNYILYQLGRGQKSGRDRVSPWQKWDRNKNMFGLKLVDTITALNKNAEQVVESIGVSLDTDLGKDLTQQAHRRLMQLYLGNLVRYQVYLTFQTIKGAS